MQISSLFHRLAASAAAEKYIVHMQELSSDGQERAASKPGSCIASVLDDQDIARSLERNVQSRFDAEWFISLSASFLFARWPQCLIWTRSLMGRLRLQLTCTAQSYGLLTSVWVTASAMTRNCLPRPAILH
jgi:hypothetical protein